MILPNTSDLELQKETGIVVDVSNTAIINIKLVNCDCADVCFLETGTTNAFYFGGCRD